MRYSVVAALAAVAASVSTGVFRQQQRPFDLRSGSCPTRLAAVAACSCSCGNSTFVVALAVFFVVGVGGVAAVAALKHP